VEASEVPHDAAYPNLVRTIGTEGANLDRYVLDAFHRLGRVASIERFRIEQLGVMAQRFAAFLLFLALMTLATLWFQRRELRRTWDRLRATVTELAEAHRIAHIGTVRWDYARNLVTWSDEFARIYGLEPGGDMSGDAFQNLLIPSDTAKVVASEQEALARSAVTGEPERREVRYRARRSDGAVIELEAQSELLADADGNPVLMVSTVRDITDEALAKRALTESERSLAAAQRIANLGSFRRNIKTGHPVWSKELYLMLGLEPGSEPPPLARIVHPDDAASIEAMLNDLCRHGAPNSSRKTEFNCRFNRADGETRHMRGMVEVTMDELGAPETLIGALRDGTDDINSEQALRDALEDAERANAAKSQFLAIASHELRTPMNGVMGMLGALEETPLTDEQKSRVSVALASANALLVILNDILDMSKIEAGRMEVETEPFEIRALVASVVNLNAQQAEEKGLALDTDIAAEVPRLVSSDAGRIRQVLVNLVSNAVKFTSHGRVTLAVAPAQVKGDEDVRLRFSVTDTGIGIPLDKQSQVFGKFNQLDASYTRRFGGTGLGLSISQSLAGLLGGTLSFESRVGKGSTFWLELPVKHATRAPASAATEPQVALSQMRILVADDNQINQLVARSMLEALGQNADFVENGLEAVIAAQSTQYDIILMDLSMPVLDGLEATRRIRSLGPRYEKTPILALTAHAGQAQRSDCSKAGFNDVLTKPIPRSLLHATLARWQAPGLNGPHADRPPEETTAPSVTRPDTVNPDFAESQSLIDTIKEFRLSLGDAAVPNMLRAGLNDLQRHVAIISTFQRGEAPADEVLKRSFHSLGGITRLFGCPSLGDKARDLETAFTSLKPDDPQIDELMGQISALRDLLETTLNTLETENPTSTQEAET
jgi:PAS domain S-box-containing protein